MPLRVRFARTITRLPSRCDTCEGVCGCCGSGGWASRTAPSAIPTRSAPNALALALTNSAVRGTVTPLSEPQAAGAVSVEYTPLHPPSAHSKTRGPAATRQSCDQPASAWRSPLSPAFFPGCRVVPRPTIGCNPHPPDRLRDSGGNRQRRRPRAANAAKWHTPAGC